MCQFCCESLISFKMFRQSILVFASNNSYFYCDVLWFQFAREQTTKRKIDCARFFCLILLCFFFLSIDIMKYIVNCVIRLIKWSWKHYRWQFQVVGNFKWIIIFKSTTYNVRWIYTETRQRSEKKVCVCVCARECAFEWTVIRIMHAIVGLSFVFKMASISTLSAVKHPVKWSPDVSIYNRSC